MKIQIGEVYMDKVENIPVPYPNKTRKYILPCLKEYGEVFINRLNNVFKVAVGIGDVIVDRVEAIYERHVFILLSSKIAPEHFIEFLDWIRDQPMYEDDYVFDNIQKSYYHMIVIKLPEKYYDSFKTFKEGKYSEMFKSEDITNIFQHYPDVQKVLVKDHNYKIRFVRRINNLFGTDITPDEYQGEYEFKPSPEGDVFNHHLKK